MKRLNIYMSHPIQYQINLLREINIFKDLETQVFFYWDFGTKESYDTEFQTKIKWDTPILSGYKYAFLKNYSFKKSANFFGCINFGIINTFFKNAPNSVLIFGWGTFSNLLVIFLSIIFNKNLYIYGESPQLHESMKKSSYNLFRRIILRAVFLKSKKIFFIGKENKKFYKGLGVRDQKLVFTPYAVDSNFHALKSEKLLSKKYDLRRKHSIKKDSLLILFCGKLIEKKRPQDLLLAFSEITKNKYKNVHLIFAGDGPMKHDLQNIISEEKINNVKFLGFVNQTKLPEIYTISDIFVLPSGLGETWGLVVNEAMYYGLPIITSSLVGCSSDLVTSENGLIYEYKNLKDLESKLLTLIDDKAKRDLFGLNSRKIISKYNQEFAAKQIVNTVLND